MVYPDKYKKNSTCILGTLKNIKNFGWLPNAFFFTLICYFGISNNELKVSSMEKNQSEDICTHSYKS